MQGEAWRQSCQNAAPWGLKSHHRRHPLVHLAPGGSSAASRGGAAAVAAAAASVARRCRLALRRPPVPAAQAVVQQPAPSGSLAPAMGCCRIPRHPSCKLRRSPPWRSCSSRPATAVQHGDKPAAPQLQCNHDAQHRDTLVAHNVQRPVTKARATATPSGLTCACWRTHHWRHSGREFCGVARPPLCWRSAQSSPSLTLKDRPPADGCGGACGAIGCSGGCDVGGCGGAAGDAPGADEPLPAAC